MPGMSTPDIIRDEALAVAEAHEAFSARVALARNRYHYLMCEYPTEGRLREFPHSPGRPEDYLLAAYVFNRAGLTFRNRLTGVEYTIPYEYFKDPDAWEQDFRRHVVQMQEFLELDK